MDIYEKLKAGKEKVALRFYSEAKSSGNILIHCDVVYVKDELTKGYSIGYYDNTEEKRQYKGLKVTALQSSACGKPFGWELEKRTYSGTMSFYEASSFIKAVKPINKKLAKFDSEEGVVISFEDYILRLAKVLNVNDFYANGDQFRSDEHYRSIECLRDYLISIIQENQVKVGFIENSKAA
jgi:hypothetical protein